MSMLLCPNWSLGQELLNVMRTKKMQSRMKQMQPNCSEMRGMEMCDGIYTLYMGVRTCPNPHIWWHPRRDSNAQPTDSKSGTLSIELRGHCD